jgi:hypothetical protein
MGAWENVSNMSNIVGKRGRRLSLNCIGVAPDVFGKVLPPCRRNQRAF